MVVVVAELSAGVTHDVRVELMTMPAVSSKAVVYVFIVVLIDWVALSRTRNY